MKTRRRQRKARLPDHTRTHTRVSTNDRGRVSSTFGERPVIRRRRSQSGRSPCGRLGRVEFRGRRYRLGKIPDVLSLVPTSGAGPPTTSRRLSDTLGPRTLADQRKTKLCPTRRPRAHPRRQTQHGKPEKLFHDYSFRRTGEKGPKRRRQTPLGRVSLSAEPASSRMDDPVPALRLANPSGIWRRRSWPWRPFAENCSRGRAFRFSPSCVRFLSRFSKNRDSPLKRKLSSPDASISLCFVMVFCGNSTLA